MKRLSLILGLLLIILSPQIRADGFIIPWPLPPDRPIPPALSIKYHHVEIKINNQYAETSVDQVFKNNYHHDLEGTYIFPIPEDASITRFSMYIGGEEIKGEVLDKNEAKRIYEEIVRRKKDPALLEYFGDGMFRARVYPILANGETRIKLNYSQVLKSYSGLCQYRYTMATEKFSQDPLESVKLTVDLTSDQPIKNIYSPTHDIKVEKISDHKAEVSYVEENTRPNKDFILYYTVSDEDIGFSLLTFKDEKEGGFFLGMVSPKVQLPQGVKIKKRVLFILDTSGSMSGKKIEQAQRALAFCLNNLNKNDSFNIIDFDDQVKSFKNGLVLATSQNVEDATKFVNDCTADGGTNIDEALQTGLDQMKGEDELNFVIFLTDGLPTVGNTDIKAILKNVKEKNDNSKVFVFGVGYDVNTHFLDRLSQENKGTSDYVSPDEDIEVKVSNFYKKISNPVLADIDLRFDGVKASLIYPAELPDIFEGSQLVILGRFEGEGKATVSLSGTAGDTKKDYAYSVNFTQEKERNRQDASQNFIPKLWASRRVAYLIDQIRLYGENNELVNEIVKLSKKYGIINEYTSFLIKADYRLADRELAEQGVRVAEEKSKMDVGSGAVYQSKNLLAMQAPLAKDVYYDASGKVQKVNEIMNVENKTFFNKNGLWVDSEYEGKMETIKIEKFSSAYFKLLTKNPKIAKYLSLGDNVIVVLNHTAIEIGEKGKTDLSDLELGEMF
jgi:Ca-activated chloride channel family protein